ncbi:MAG: division/cell wall cluster transcriptional repressor MraZ [Bacteroidetes bacterium]|jgi:MraZ protein|nr:division/cell wall cluster transcriptional repressor MraZ [Bacteroidota bacterium]MBT3747964.1 division/cell wall cluster transcriptional repressor MraZ [Bacteroidota bacterium]MBT4401770.1 division/cell wall cluster transcriptional repressor MraZ [Bacteroidota bacterium]MBT4409202.1 division/cell wall cluster transcriptional repressor MraZ [Bacteroidota bacterium]MBT5424556.1 division/cell wall cluster transcriptional repressor MraZ [Bacteroidota bacterium]
MSRFKGDHYCKVDSKGRFLFPAKLKKQMPSEAGETFVGKMNTFEKSLILYPENVWDKLVSRTLSKLNPYNERHDQFRRDFFRDVLEMELDGSGRILLPRRFLDDIGVEPGKQQEVALSGQGNVVELMAASGYQSGQLSDEERRSLAEEVMGDFKWDDE